MLPKKVSSEKGVILYIALIFLGIVLMVVLAVILLFTREFIMSSNIKAASKAIFAAETGIEVALAGFKEQGEDLEENESFLRGTLSNGASYEVDVQECCFPLRLKSVGTFGRVKRAVEIAY